MAKASSIKDLRPDASLEENAHLIIRARLKDMYQWSSFVDQPYAVHGLHNLRIAAKRLRYTLELFLDVLPSAAQNAIEELTHLQDALGVLHDNDVMIALLRLCLGGQDGGTGYAQALVQAGQRARKGAFTLPPLLVSALLDPTVAPSAQERYGLERLLFSLQQQRERLYTEAREYWYQLQAKDIRREILALLDA
jgi:hypothetical protein